MSNTGTDPLHLTQDHTTTAVPARLAQLRGQLPPRDLTILRDVAALRLATALHLQRLRFAQDGSPLTQARRARRSLARLHNDGLLARLDRRIGGARAGSASYIYRLTPHARRLLGLPGPHGGRPTHQPPPQHVDHTLATTELAVTLHETHHTGALELLRFDAEPACWRTYTGPGGERLDIRPDAFTIIANGRWEHLWFIEVDLGTEHLATLQRKAHAYRHYATTGIEQTRWGVFPRVAYLTPDPARRTAIHDALAATPDADALLVVGHLHHPTTTLTTTGDNNP